VLSFTNAMTAGSGTVEIEQQALRSFSSNILYEPLNSDFMFTAKDKPNVLVTVNNIMSGCVDNCDFEFIDTPRISAATLAGNTVSLTIQDGAAYYGSDITELTVDGQTCTVAPTVTAIANFDCTLPTNTNGEPLLTAGDHVPVLKFSGINIHAVDPATPATISVNMAVTGSSLTDVPQNGGHAIELSGNNFPEGTTGLTVTACGVEMYLISSSNVMIRALTSICETGLGAQNIEITFAGQTVTQAINVVAADASTPTITAVSPDSWSPVLKSRMTVTGTNFGTDITKLSATLRNATNHRYNMKVLSASDTSVVVGIPGGIPGEYYVGITHETLGDALVTGTVNKFEYKLSISSISPLTGSKNGGTLITITGTNFSPEKSENLVFIGN